MLTRLGPDPAPIAGRIGTTMNRPSLTAAWIGRPPRRRPLYPRIRLAAGVWVIREPAVHLGYHPPAWMARGLCAALPIGQTDSLFFGVEIREAPGALIAAANKARKICAHCPVAITCLTDALVNDERYGVWGGTSGRQREKMRLRLAAGAAVDQLVAETLPHRASA